MLNLTYNYKLQPTDEQIELIEHNLAVCKSVWNAASSACKSRKRDALSQRLCLCILENFGITAVVVRLINVLLKVNI